MELPDKYGHMYGPKSPQLNHVLEEIDAEMVKLMDSLDEAPLKNKVNVMFFSDHGMADMSESRVINITDAVNTSDIALMLDAGPNCYIWPNEGKLEKVVI